MNNVVKQIKEEKVLQARILVALRAIEGCVVFAHTASPFSPTGHSDMYGSIYGCSFWAEIKLPGKKVTAIQRAFLKQMGKEAVYKNTFVWTLVSQAVKDIKKLSKQVKENK